MAKISYKGLTRGIRLAANQVWQPMNQIAQAITSIKINSDNLDRKLAPFCITFNSPYIPPTFSRDKASDGTQGTLMFPFMALPPQDQYSNSGITSMDPVQLTITDVTISLDHAAESVGIQDGTYNANHYLLGKLSELYTVNVEIKEKTPLFYGPVSGGNYAGSEIPNRTVWSGKVDGAVFGTAMVNPFTWTDLSIQLNPYATYVAMVQFPNIYDETLGTAENMPAVVSFVLELRGTSSLMQRDRGGTQVQNLPTVQNGYANNRVVIMDEPTGGDLIRTGNNNVGGLDGAMRLLDFNLFQNMIGGYNQDSTLPATEQMAVSAAYDIIAVPMWGGFGNNACIYNHNSAANNTSFLPFLTDVETATGVSVDRRIIPIPYPMTVQYVLAVANYVAPQLGTSITWKKPLSFTFTHSVSVNIAAGNNSELFAVQPIASLEWSGISPYNYYFLDSVVNSANSVNNGGVEIRQVPLIGNTGSGPYAQGKPVFVGRATTKSFDRSPINGNAPATQGCEQYLDIRWRMRDSAGMAGTTRSADTIFAGTSGHWILLYCKKHLLGGTAELNV